MSFTQTQFFNDWVESVDCVHCTKFCLIICRFSFLCLLVDEFVMVQVGRWSTVCFYYRPRLHNFNLEGDRASFFRLDGVLTTPANVGVLGRARGSSCAGGTRHPELVNGEIRFALV